MRFRLSLRSRSAVAAVVTAGALVASACGAADQSISTVTVTEQASVTVVGGTGTHPVDESGTRAVEPGAPITVLAPQQSAAGDSDAGSTGADVDGDGDPAEESGQETAGGAASSGSDQADDGGDAATPGAGEQSDDGTAAPAATPATSTAPATSGRAAREAARAVGTQCGALLTSRDITDALGMALAPEMLRVDDEPNPAIGMTQRSKCYYGTSDLAVARPLVVALAAYADENAAQQQLDVTAASEAAAGAATATTNGDTPDVTIRVLLRDGGLALAQRGTVTVSIAIADGVIADSALTSALTLLMRDALRHLN